MAIADLEKAKIRSRRQRASCFRNFSKGSRCKHPAAYGPKQPRAGPCHALEKAAAIDSVVFVIVRNVIWHNLVPKLASKVSFHLFLPIRREFIPEIIRIGPAPVIFRNFLLCGCCFSKPVLKKRRAQASAHSAAFETDAVRS